MKDKSGKVGKWIDMSLLTNWTNYSSAEYMSAGYMIDEVGMVHLRGTIYNNTDRGEHICVLPPIYRPHRSSNGIVLYGGDTTKRLYISNRDGGGYGLGHIFLISGSGSGWISIDNISWWVGKERLRQL